MAGANTCITLLGRCRISIKECIDLGPPTLITANRVPPPVNDLDDITMTAYTNELFSYIQKLLASNPIINDLKRFIQQRETNNLLYLADYAGGLTVENRDLQQKVALSSRSLHSSSNLLRTLSASSWPCGSSATSWRPSSCSRT